ncbi:D(4) dopamine receptor [Pelobates cultripes]|uniref:D(4) dopamine receptor n=2 Tax=Pelobates cultripes TaxID=61616 RepID=A0AAD1TFX5_PELCU|nr:D(4) dopamine receptor [Pelobates cultripes]
MVFSFGEAEGCFFRQEAMVVNISNQTSHHVPPDDTHYNYLALVFGLLLVVIIICGNVLVCLSVCTEKALKTTTNYFIVSLAVADLLLAVLVLPLYVYTEFLGGMWTLSLVLCDALMTMDVMLCTASIFNLCAISVDRFIAVSIPLHYNRQQVDNRQLFLISTTWIFAFAVASPVIFGLNNVAGRDPNVCKLEDNNYIIYSSVCSFFIPCPIMVVLYCAMFHGLRKWEETRKAKLLSHMSPGPGRKPQCPNLLSDSSHTDSKLDELHLYAQQNCPFSKSYVDNGHGIQTVAYPPLKYSNNKEPERKHAKINGRERKAMKVLPVVVGAFLFCWTPFFVVHITRAVCESCSIPEPLISIVTWLGYVNSALNPVIYTIFNTEFRNYFRKVLRLCC